MTIKMCHGRQQPVQPSAVHITGHMSRAVHVKHKKAASQQHEYQTLQVRTGSRAQPMDPVAGMEMSCK